MTDLLPEEIDALKNRAIQRQSMIFEPSEPKPVSKPARRQLYPVPPLEEQKRYTMEEAFGSDWVQAQKRSQCIRMMGETSCFAGILLSDPTTLKTHVWEALKAELVNPALFYLLLGGVGCGKTYAAVGFVGEQSGASKYFIYAYDLAILINKGDSKTLDIIKKARYLIIDDLGTEPDGFKGADFISYFDSLINARYEHRRLTVITSNMTLNNTTDESGKPVLGIIDRYGERFVSRFRSSGRVIESEDPDFRSEGVSNG